MAATIELIAKKLGISRTTVFRALNDKPRVSAATKARVLKAAAELQYRPNLLASGLRSNHSMTIGLVFTDLMAGDFYSEIFHGVENIATINNYSVILGCSENNIHKEKNIIELFCNRRVDGIIVSPTSGTDLQHYIDLQKEGIPFVFVDKYLPQINTDVVTTDGADGARQAVTHLIEMGYRKILFLSGPEFPCTTIESRLEGYREALKLNNLSYERIVFTDKFSLKQRESGYRALQEYLDNHGSDFDAVFAVNDGLAIGAMRALREKNIKIPNDVAIVGCDDDDITRYLDIQLTTVAQPKYTMGQKAMEILIARINGEKAVGDYQFLNLKTNLVVRNSSRKWK